MKPDLHTRLIQKAEGEELLALSEKRGSVICRCGKRRDEHDLAEDWTLPCRETGCLDFTRRFGKTPASVGSMEQRKRA
jgi:hypothetical protein